jgi:natural product biosynthesis luciferase-like monooxygenase protein
MDFSVYFFSANDEHEFGERYRFILDVARFIDEHGFTAIWTPERHFQEFGGSFPNPAVLSAALAVTTTRLQLRAGSVVLPHHHPVRAVEEWALVDQLSGGRTGLCVATGWHQGDFVFYPENYETRREYTFGHVATVQALWRGEKVTFPGPGGVPLEVRTYPRPKQAELPLWLVHTSNPTTWTTAGEKGLNVLTLLDSWERLEQNIAAYRDARERAGHDPATGVVTVGLHTYVGDDEDEVWSLVRGPVKKYLASFMTQKHKNDTMNGRAADAAEQDRLSDMMAEDYYRRRSLLGTADKCADVVRRLERIGVTEVACLVDFGLPFDTVMAALPNLDALRSRMTPEPVTTPAGTDVGWYYQR